MLRKASKLISKRKKKMYRIRPSFVSCWHTKHCDSKKMLCKWSAHHCPLPLPFRHYCQVLYPPLWWLVETYGTTVFSSGCDPPTFPFAVKKTDQEISVFSLTLSHSLQIGFYQGRFDVSFSDEILELSWSWAAVSTIELKPFLGAHTS